MATGIEDGLEGMTHRSTDSGGIPLPWLQAGGALTGNVGQIGIQMGQSLEGGHTTICLYIKEYSLGYTAC